MVSNASTVLGWSNVFSRTDRQPESLLQRRMRPGRSKPAWMLCIENLPGGWPVCKSVRPFLGFIIRVGLCLSEQEGCRIEGQTLFGCGSECQASALRLRTDLSGDRRVALERASAYQETPTGGWSESNCSTPSGAPYSYIRFSPYSSVCIFPVRSTKL